MGDGHFVVSISKLEIDHIIKLEDGCRSHGIPVGNDAIKVVMRWVLHDESLPRG